ncbi:MAG: helix-hairpin-helix domain-containing protein [Rhodoferax sp.]
MRTWLITCILLLAGLAAQAAMDVNQADEAELDSIKGIGPALSGRILAERKKGAFKDWADLMARIKGIRPASAAKFSRQGLTVDGVPFDEALPEPPRPAQAKP